jgi:hypothetical protein
MDGFESILSKITTAGNFNWCLHVTLFMHTLQVIQKQLGKSGNEGKEEDEQDDDKQDDDADVENQ